MDKITNLILLSLMFIICIIFILSIAYSWATIPKGNLGKPIPKLKIPRKIILLNHKLEKLGEKILKEFDDNNYKK